MSPSLGRLHRPELLVALLAATAKRARHVRADRVTPAYVAIGRLALVDVDAAAGGMRIGLIWWTAGMALAVAYFIFLYTSFRRRSD